MPFEVGQVVSDYEILDVLGKGGMGRVYRVRNVISNRVEAMKVLLADVAAEPELTERFGSEIRTVARLDHQNIGKLFTAFKIENQLVMIMEFVEGFTLTERARQAPIPLNDVISYVGQTLAALQYAHENGVVHRDVKPSNIMITPHGIVKLMDFGIAKSNTDTMHTRAGTTMGSMLYMSPEQVRGTTVDARSDLYSLGVVLYELTAGRRPFEAESTYAVLEAQLNAPPRPPIEVNPALPKPLNDIILTALEKEPMRRFQSAEAFRHALESLRAPQATQTAQPSARPALPSLPAPARPRGNRAIWMALGAVVCVLVLIGAVLLTPSFRRGRAAAKGSTAPAPVQTASVQPAPSPATAPAPVQTAGLQSAPAPMAQEVVTHTAPATQSLAIPAQNQTINSVTQPVQRKLTRTPSPKPAETATQSSTPVATAPQPAPAVQAPAPAVQGPSQEEIDKVQENLMQLHARADAVKNSVNSLRRQQAADGLEISPEISGAASRLDNYLQAADRASQSSDLTAARRYMDNAERQLTLLEAKFGR
jgi:serine/threonine-protein kinase